MHTRHFANGAKRHGGTLLNVALSVLGAAFVLAYIHPFGVRLTPDSAAYFAAARSVVAGEGFRDVHGLPLGEFPPLFPLVLGAASLGIFDPQDLAGFLNAFFAGLTAFVVGQYLRGRLESQFLAAWGCLMAALAYPHLLRAYLAHTEPLFVLLSVLALINTDRFLANGRTRTLLWAAAFAALACATRYIGVSLLALMGLLVLLHPQAASSSAQRAGRVAMLSLVGAAPVALWLFRNHLVIGSLSRQSVPKFDPESMLASIWESHWLWSDGANAWAILLLLVLAAMLWRRMPGEDWRPVWLFGGYSLSYTVFLLVILLFFVSIGDKAGSLRYWLPLYLPLMIASLCVLDRVLAAVRKHPLLGSAGGGGGLPILGRVTPGIRRRVLTALVVILLSLDAAGAVKQNTRTLTRAYRGDLSLAFNGPRFTGSETLRYIRETPGVVGTVYSNDPYTLYLHTHKDGLRTEFFPKEPSRFAIHLAHAPIPSFLALLYEMNATGFDDSDSGLGLRAHPGLERLAEFEDGIVFEIVGIE